MPGADHLPCASIHLSRLSSRDRAGCIWRSERGIVPHTAQASTKESAAPARRRCVGRVEYACSFQHLESLEGAKTDTITLLPILVLKIGAGRQTIKLLVTVPIPSIDLIML